MKIHKFVDSVVVQARAGSGGNGCVSFRREKFVPHGGPNGGDGGRGGHVIFRVSHDENSLIRLYYAPHPRGEPGGSGKGKDLHGRNGKDKIVNVPRGTEIWSEDNQLIADLVEDGKELIVAHGGKGGLGNSHWKSATHQAPREHTDGKPGEELKLRLELKLMADAGLIGFPNAGKSSLLTQLSDAHPKIAAYPFTTLNPIIGTLIFEDYSRLTVADIPGILKGAHEGVGLGHAFLRHVERARYLVYVVDMAGVDNRSPITDYRDLTEELRLYNERLATHPSLVVANKMDLPEAQENLGAFIKETGTDPIQVSAANGDGIATLKAAVQTLAHG